MDREKVIKELHDVRRYLEDKEWSDRGASPHIDAINDALALIKEQEEQKRKWLQTIADTQLAISPTGYESEDELAKRGWEWNGLQIAWEIIAGEERSEHPKIVRCKDCKHARRMCQPWNDLVCEKNGQANKPEWFCADGEREKGR